MYRLHHEHHGRSASAVVAGDGATVVLLPGFLQSARRYVDAGWVDALATRFRVVAVDPAGFGEGSTAYRTDDYTADAFVDDLFGIYDRLEIDRAHVVGYSQGVLRGCLLAHRFPERVRSLVAGGSALFDQLGRFRDLGIDVDGMYDQAVAALKASDWPSFWEVFPAPLADTTKRMLESVNDPVSAGHVLEAARVGFPPFELPAVPTLAYWGSGELFHEANTTIAADAGIEAHVVDGEHDGAFVDVDAAMAAIVPFLEAN